MMDVVLTDITAVCVCDKTSKFQPRSTDVFVTGSPKSGTTWLQQTIHQLSTGGDMDFEDIGHVVSSGFRV